MLVVGCIGAAFGIKGWSHVRSFTDPPGNLANFSHLFVRQQHSAWEPLTSFEFQTHQSGLIFKAGDTQNRTEAEAIVNFELGIERDALPSLEINEFYWIDLIGLDVINSNEDQLGTVEDIHDTGTQSVIKVTSSEAEYLIPLIKPILLKIELDSHICVHWNADWTA